MRKNVKLNDILTISRGASPRPIAKYITTNSNGINWIKIGDVKQDSFFITKTDEKITPEGAKKSRYVKPGDFILSNSMSFGRPYILQIYGCVHDGWLILSDYEKNVTSLYLYYLLKSTVVQNQFYGSANGSTVRNLNSDIVRDVTVCIHSDFEVQQQIVNHLNLIQSAIDNKQKQLSELDELVKSRFIEMFGDPVSNEKGWEVKSLDLCCDGIGDGLHGTPEYVEESDYPFINGNNLDGNIIISSSTKFVSKETFEKHYIFLTENALLLSINGTLGKLAYFNGEAIMLGKSACYLNLKKEINKRFVFGLMSSEFFLNFMEHASTKSTIKNVGLKAIREYKLILPPLSLQNSFATFVQQIDKSKFVVKQQINDLQELMDSKMQEYFGE